jgi:poly(3-hydroxybutyrate) depolymerase
VRYGRGVDNVRERPAPLPGAWFSVAVLAGLVLAQMSSAGDTAGQSVQFLPTPAGTIGAFLVSGPYDGARTELESAGPVTEGDVWRLVVAKSGEKGIVLASDGERRFHYVYATLSGHARSTSRNISFVSSGTVACWLDGQKAVESRPYVRRDVRPDDGAGPVSLLLRVEASRGSVAVVVAASLALADGRSVLDLAQLSLADGGRERVAGLVSAAIEVTLTPLMAREGEDVLAQVLRVGAFPAVGGDLSTEIRIGDRTLGDAEIPSLTDLARKPIQVNFRATADLGATYKLSAVLSVDNEPLAQSTAVGYVEEGLVRLADDLEARASRIVGIPSASAYARLQAEKVRLCLARAGGPSDPKSLGNSLAEARRALDEAEAGRDFQAGMRGSLERAYVSEIDDSAQPYLVYIPDACRPGTGPWPMVVYLHGYVPSYNKDAWVRPDSNFNAVMEAEGCVLAIPFARSNTDFLNVGEDDVLDVIEEMKRAYPVDERRISLYGYSMGGSGVWTMLAHYPDRFSGAVVLAGRSDYYLWHGLDRSRVPAWKRHIIDADNPIDLVANFKHVPVRVYHGDADYVVKTAQSERMVAALKKLGANAEMHWVRNGSHWSLFDAVMWSRDPVAWVKDFKTPETPPPFDLKTFHVRYARAWGVEARGFVRELDPIEFSLMRRGVNDTALETSNVDSVVVYPSLLGGRRLSMEAGFKVVGVDDTDLSWSGKAARDGVTYYSENWRRPGLRKSTALCGPVKEAYRSAFVLVYGTSGSKADTARLKGNAMRFASEWQEFAKGALAIRADIDVDAETMETKNVVLFGEPNSNVVISRVAARLPIEWDEASATIAGTPYSLAERGLVFVYPNPDAPERLAVFMSGLFWGGSLPINHKWDFVPDFIVFENTVDPFDRMDPVNKAVVAGFFDAGWGVAEHLIFAARTGGRANAIAARRIPSDAPDVATARVQE